MKRHFTSLLISLPALLALTATAAVRYVNVGNPSPLAPFTSWATAATNLQAAVDVAVSGDDIVVTNGVYRTGGARAEYGEITNRVAINKPVIVRSVNGPFVTFIEGNQIGAAIRCAYVTNGAVLAGFTLTNGAAHSQSSEYGYETVTGGGVWCEPSAVVSNCVITGNSVQDSGGGSYGGILKGCSLFGNSAPNRGGGASSGTLINCTLTANTAAIGGGTESCALQNSIAYHNQALIRDPNYSGGTVDYSCTTPLPASGTGNIATEPQLADRSHLSAASPCRGAGNAIYSSGRDIDGQLWLSPPAMGCDEYGAGLTGSLAVTITAPYTNVAANFALDLSGNISGSATVNRWDFGDSVILSNRLVVTHAWVAAGDYPVVFRAFNASNPGGVSTTVTVHVVTAPIHYVARSNALPVAPYTSWATAATNIQDAVDAATAVGVLVLVTNGVYDTGGGTAFDSSNRVAVLKPLVLQSVNGPANTIINGGAQARGAALVPGVLLNGFTLTNGSSGRGGGVYGGSPAAVITNCVLIGNGAYEGGGAFRGTFNNCTFTANSVGSTGGGAHGANLNNCLLQGNQTSWVGGGAYLATLNNCTLLTNNAFFGGGASSAWLTNCVLSLNTSVGGGGADASALDRCTLTGNSAAWYGGGGTRDSSLVQCTLGGNWADFGGGAESSRLLRCTMTTNWTAGTGGGANDSFLTNCVVAGNCSQGSGGGVQACSVYGSALYANSATNNGGAAEASTLINCTVTGNSANAAGGTLNSDVMNSIVQFNTAVVSDANYQGGSLNFSCTTPLPSGGTGNFTNAPQLADFAHLSAGSPCRAAGSAAFTVAQDIDGESWAGPPSVGADEFYSGSVTGALGVGILAAYTNVATGFPVQFIAQINGRASVSRWDFADGTIVSNQPYASHAWVTAGNQSVVLRAYNDSFPAGISATVTVQVVSQPIHFVSRNNLTPVAPYTSWVTAATNIQDAVDVATTIGSLVLVTNGVYDAGGGASFSLSNRVLITRPITLRSVNGPAVTRIDGRGAARCVFLPVGATLLDLTLTNGVIDGDGGGAYCTAGSVVISNCVLSGNTAFNAGGGVFRGTLVDCTLRGNSGFNVGGGAFASTLNSCLLTGNNTVGPGGGASECTLNNCSLTTNSAFFGGGANASVLNHCALSFNFAEGGGGANASTLSFCALGTNTAGSYGGGGVRGSTVSDSTFRRNRAGSGGGADNSTLNRCSVLENVALDVGGGVSGGTLSSCALWANAATNMGGGAVGAVLINCTVTGNTARSSAGGAHSCTLSNSIVYYNQALTGGNYTASDLNFCFTTPLPATGVGNFTTEPRLADAAHLSVTSPCRAAGSATIIHGTDVDGEAWLNPPAVGADEFRSGSSTGALSVAILARYTNVAVGYPVDFTALIDGHAASNRWDFGDGTNVNNQLYPSHSWEIAGDYSVVFRAYNETIPAGVSVTSIVHVIWQPTHYVSLTSTNPVAPYFAWTNAATNLQQAVDVAYAGGVVLATNGIYEVGGRVVYGTLSNRLVVTTPIQVKSVNGAGVTSIRGAPTNGANAVRCVYLGGAASLSGFTLTNGATRTDGDGSREQAGGALWCESLIPVVSDCVLIGNSAGNSAGAAYRGTLVNCTISRNTAAYGGGAQESLLIGCLLSSNSATLGGGTYAATLKNCVLSNNVAGLEGGGAAYGTLSNCVVRGNTAHVAGGTFAAVVLNSSLITNNTSWYAGGAWGCSFTNCTITGNFGSDGGGVSASTLSQCSVIANTTSGSGGGADGCLLERCTIALNSATNYGGGASGSTLYNCLVSSNRADSAGGAYVSGLNNCVLARNTAAGFGGGARESTLVNCTVYGNTASNSGGGVYDGTVTNSIVQNNVDVAGSNNYSGGTFSYTSTTPLPPGPGNFTNSPALGNPAAGNFRLQFGSVGINAGYTPAAPLGNDCDNLPRAVGPVDLGPYEYQTPASQLSYYWLAKYGLPANGTADAIDSDGDSLSNYLEWILDSNPTNALSKFLLVTITNNPTAGLDVIWQSSSWRTYSIERGTNLADVPAFQPVAAGILGQSGTTTFTDAEATNAGPYFYRVGLQP